MCASSYVHVRHPLRVNASPLSLSLAHLSRFRLAPKPSPPRVSSIADASTSVSQSFKTGEKRGPCRSIRKSSEIPSSILFSSSEIRDSIGGKNTLIVDRSRNRLQLLEILEKKRTRERVKRGTKKFHCGFFSTRERERN